MKDAWPPLRHCDRLLPHGSGRYQVHQLPAFEAREPVLDARVGLDLLVRLEQLGGLQTLQDRVLVVRQRQHAARSSRHSHQLRARGSPRQQPPQRQPAAWHMRGKEKNASGREELSLEPVGTPMPWATVPAPPSAMGTLLRGQHHHASVNFCAAT